MCCKLEWSVPSSGNLFSGRKLDRALFAQNMFQLATSAHAQKHKAVSWYSQWRKHHPTWQEYMAEGQYSVVRYRHSKHWMVLTQPMCTATPCGPLGVHSQHPQGTSATPCTRARIQIPPPHLLRFAWFVYPNPDPLRLRSWMKGFRQLQNLSLWRNLLYRLTVLTKIENTALSFSQSILKYLRRLW